MLLLGCHLSAAKGYAYMGREAVSIGANTFQFFTRNPRGGSAKALDPEDVTRFRDFAAQAGIPVILAHAPYTLNGCSGDENVRRFARETMADDLRRMEATPGNLYNFHPGSHVGQGVEAGITLIAQMLNQTLFPEMTTTVLLETMAGKGSEVGGRFEELREILDRAELSARMGVCLDTCHLNDAGYDVARGSGRSAHRLRQGHRPGAGARRAYQRQQESPGSAEGSPRENRRRVPGAGCHCPGDDTPGAAG